MSQAAVRAVLHRYPIGGGERMAAIVLADLADERGQGIACFVKEIARRCHLERRTVQRHIRAMLARGWLVRVSIAGGQGVARQYQIDPQWLAVSQVGSNHAEACTSPCQATP